MGIAEASTVSNGILPSHRELREWIEKDYGDISRHGWRVRMRHWFDYVAHDKIYEAVVDGLVTEGCSWIDVGTGRNIFPHNRDLSLELARRAGLLVGVDPSDNVQTNDQVSERAQCTIEEYETDRTFDLATLRMVAEHVSDPDSALQKLAGLIKPGGKVVVYTPNRWAPVSIAARLTPFWMHRVGTKVLWGSQSIDVFPTVYRMNTRKTLRELFSGAGFHEAAFAYLDDPTTLHRFRVTCFGELCLWRGFRALGVRYPENNLLGVYERRVDGADRV